MMTRIQQYEVKYREAVIRLILDIQQKEFNLDVSIEDQPDLLAIPENYISQNGNFWIALDGEKVIGTIALTDLGDQKAALRKMFVDAGYRGQQPGVAKLLLSALLGWAKQKGFRDVYLGTAAPLHAAHRFYEKNGFREVKKTDVPPGKYLLALDTKFYHYSL